MIFATPVIPAINPAGAFTIAVPIIIMVMMLVAMMVSLMFVVISQHGCSGG